MGDLVHVALGRNAGADVEELAVSRRFVAATKNALADLMSADLSGLNLVAFMVDGVHFGEHVCVVALGITLDGTKVPLAIEEGSTENATLVTSLIVGLRERGLDVTRPVLAVLDGSKALHRAVKDVFDHPVIARCQLHKIRNVRDRLPGKLRTVVERRMREAYHAESARPASSSAASTATCTYPPCARPSKPKSARLPDPWCTMRTATQPDAIGPPPKFHELRDNHSPKTAPDLWKHGDSGRSHESHSEPVDLSRRVAYASAFLSGSGGVRCTQATAPTATSASPPPSASATPTPACVSPAPEPSKGAPRNIQGAVAVPEPAGGVRPPASGMAGGRDNAGVSRPEVAA
jgi:Transposase, Mutator family